MGTEVKKTITGLSAEEPELNKLFQESLSGLRDDLNEAQQNVDMYFAAVNGTGGKEMYGPLYNDALKIKGLARERQLKFIDMFKDRVTKKEILNSNIKKEVDLPFDHSQLNKMIDEVNQGKKFENIKPVISQNIPIAKQIPYSANEEEIDHDIEDHNNDDEEEEYDQYEEE